MVCWFHMTNTYADDSFTRASGHLGWLGVEIFFVISGFVIPYSLFQAGYTIAAFGRFLLKRVVRIDPAFLISALLCLVLWYLASFTPGFRGDSPDPSYLYLISHVGYLNDILDLPWLNPVFWSLAIEFQYYILIALLFGLIANKNPVVLVFSILILSLAPLWLKNADFVFHYLALFSLGIIVFVDMTDRLKNKQLVWCLFVVSAATCFWSLGVQAAFVATLTSLAIRFLRVPDVRVFRFLGTISYSLYLLHVPIGGRVVNLGKRFVDQDYQLFLLSLLATTISIIAAYLFFRLVEKPSHDFSRSIKLVATPNH